MFLRLVSSSSIFAKRRVYSATFLSKKVSSMVKKKTTTQEKETLAEEVRNHPCLYISHINLNGKSDPGYKEKEKSKRKKIAK